MRHPSLHLTPTTESADLRSKILEGLESVVLFDDTRYKYDCDEEADK